MPKTVKKIKYTKGQIGKVKVVKDFLPPPEKLKLKGRKKTDV